MPRPRLTRCGLLLVPLLCAAAPQKSAFSHVPAEEWKAGEPMRLEGNLTGPGSWRRLVVKARSPGQEYEEFPLELQYGDLYRGTLPASMMAAPGVEYYVEGVREGDERVPLLGSPSAPLRVLVPGRVSPSAVVRESPAAPKCKKGRTCKDPGPPPEESAEGLSRNRGGGQAPALQTVDLHRAGASSPANQGDSATPLEVKSEPRTANSGAPRDPAAPPPPLAGRVAHSPEGPHKRSELEDELAVYAAEDSGGVAQHLEDRSRHSAYAPTVLTAAQLSQLGVRTVYEALQQVPGLTVSRDVQGFWRVAVRGIRSDPEVLFFLDGHRLNSFYDGKALSNLPVETLDRIEVYRGPATADLGLGDSLAVIKLVSNRDEGVRASVTGGSSEAFDGHLSAAHAVGAAQLFLAADVVNQRGQQRAVARDGADPATGAARAKTTNDRRFLVSVGGGAAYASERLGDFELSARFMSESRSALIGAFDVVGEDSRLGWQVLLGALSWKKPVGTNATVSARLWFDQQSTDRLWQVTPAGYQARSNAPETVFPDGILEKVLVGTRGFGLDTRLELVLPRNNRLSAGLSAELRSLIGYDWLANYQVGTNVYTGPALQRASGLVYPTEDGKGGRGPAADRPGLGFFAADTWTPSEAVTIQAGFRVDLTQLPSVDSTGAWTGKSLVPSVGPRVGVSIAPIDALAARLTYGRSFRAPTVQELAEQLPNSDWNQGRFIGNPSLEGAYVDAVEANGEYLQGVGDARLRLRAAFFFERFSSPIAAVDNTGNLVPYRNRPQGVQAMGVEGEIRLEVNRRTTAWLNSSWVRAEDLGTPPSARLLTDVPQARFNAGFTVPVGPWLDLDLIGNFASERRNDSRSVLELIRRYTLPGYTTVAAQLRTEPIFEHAEVIVTAQNVFNFEYSDDVPRPDRITGGLPRETFQLFVTLRVRF